MVQRQNIPTPVKMVAAAYLLMAVVNFCYFFFLLSAAPCLTPPTLFKVLLSIAAAIGLLNLREGWRIFTLFITGLGLLILPLYSLAIFFSSDFVLLVSRLSGIESWIGLELVVALSFAMCLWIFRTLMRPDVKRAFESGEQEHRQVSGD